MKKILIFALCLISMLALFGIAVTAEDVSQTEIGDETNNTPVYMKGVAVDAYFNAYEESALNSLISFEWSGSFTVQPDIMDNYASSVGNFKFVSSPLTVYGYNALPMLELSGKDFRVAYASDSVRFRVSVAEDGYMVLVYFGDVTDPYVRFHYSLVEADGEGSSAQYVLSRLYYTDDLGVRYVVTDFTDFTIKFYFNLADIQLEQVSSYPNLNNMYLFSAVFGISRVQDFYSRRTAYADGYEAGVAVSYDTGFTDGYSYGYADHEDQVSAFQLIIAFVKALFEAPFRLVVSFLNIEVFGINLMWIVSTLIALAIALWVGGIIWDIWRS